MRLILLTPSLGTGGMEHLVADLALGFSHRVQSLLVSWGSGDTYAPILESAGVRCEQIPRPTPDPWQVLRAGTALARILRRERPHLIHAHNPVSGAAAALARRLARLPGIGIVTTHHGSSPERAARAVAVLRRSSDLVVGVSPSNTRALVEAGLPVARSATVFNAVHAVPARSGSDVRRELGAEGSQLLVSVGRLAPQKNQALLLDALTLLAPEHPRLRALIVGRGELEDDLRQRIRRGGLDDVVSLTGRRLDAIDIIAAADLFVLSSDWEGLPLVLLEAMVCGCPVVATDVGGTRDVLRHEQTGLLVEPRQPAALAAAIDRALGDEELRRSMASRARAFVERECSPDAMLERYEVVYAATLERRRRVRAPA